MQDFLKRTISDLVTIPSLSGQEKGVADYVFGHLSRSGLTPMRDDDDNVWVEIGPSSKKVLHVNGHMDTVVPADGWKTDPLKPVVEGDLLYGLGSTDCKSGLAAMLWLAPRARPQVRTVFSFTVCEEGIGHAKQNGSRRISAMGGTWAITAEPSCRADGACVSLGTQGHARSMVKFAGKAAHSSRPDLGENAVLAAARFCLELEKLHATFPEQEIYPGVKARASVAPTVIKGGKISNMIPDSCEVMVSRRLAPGERRETFKAELDRLLAGVKATYELFGDGPCATVDFKGALFEAARKAVAEVMGEERFGFQRGRTDAVIYAGCGMDTITIGPGQVGQSHCANEHVDLRVAVDGVKVLEKVINALA